VLSFISCGGYKSKYKAVMEYNGIKLTEEFYNYWVATYKRNILTSYADAEDTEEFWGSMYNDTMTVEDYFTEIINNRLMNYLIAQDLYKKNTLKLPKSTKDAINADIDEKIDFYGGRSALNKTLSELMLNIDALKEIYTWEAKHNYVYDSFFGEGGPLEISDSDLIDYYEKNYYHIQYIVFYMTNIQTDENGNYVYDSNGDLVSVEMTEAEKEQKKKKIAEFEGRLNSGESFDELIKEYNEFNTDNYPNGFYLSVNEIDIWGSDIFNAVKSSEINKVSKVEEAEAIFYVKRLELTKFASLSDTEIVQLENLPAYATTALYNEFFSELYPDVKINKELMNKYKLSEVTANKNYSI
jgi:parvulin-like peptidyl-prolyl isomerase